MIVGRRQEYLLSRFGDVWAPRYLCLCPCRSLFRSLELAEGTDIQKRHLHEMRDHMETDTHTRLDDFRDYRTKMNERILGVGHLGINRFFNLDTVAFNDGALTGKTKELLGLVASTVLRCNDCIDYHLIQCVEVGYTDEELHDALNVALVVGG